MKFEKNKFTKDISLVFQCSMLFLIGSILVIFIIPFYSDMLLIPFLIIYLFPIYWYFGFKLHMHSRNLNATANIQNLDGLIKEVKKSERLWLTTFLVTAIAIGTYYHFSL